MSNNINLDKFYTPLDIAKKCIDITFATFPNISETIEPSAGNGSFSCQIPNCIAYDIEPEHETIIKQNFLELNLQYKKGRLFIGNPPFGNRNNMAKCFYRHACKMGDFVGFILPISQYNNTDSLYEFDLIASYDLGVLQYSGMKVNCCFNLYSRNLSGMLNVKDKNKYKTDLFTIYRDDLTKYADITDYDFCLIRRGASIGKIKSKNIETSSYKIKVHDKSKLDFVIKTITEFNWHNYKHHQSAPSMSKIDVYRLFI